MINTPDKVGGQAYNLSFEPKHSLGKFIEPYLDIVGVRLPNVHMPLRVALWLGFLILLRRPIRCRIPLNRAVVRCIAMEQTASCIGQHRDLECEPFYSLEERRTRTWLTEVWLQREPLSSNRKTYMLICLLMLVYPFRRLK